MNTNKNESYFRKLIKGKLPLSITFWIWFVFLTLTISVFTEINFSDVEYHKTEFSKKVDLLLYILTFIYTVFIFVAVIRSANKYKGSKLFSSFAKILVTINLVVSLYSAIDITKLYFFEDYAIGAEISMFQKELPIMVNSYTQLENIEKVEKSIFYTYKLLRKDIKRDKNLRLKKFKKDVQNSLCEDDNTLSLLKKDYTLDYKYVDMNDEKIIHVVTNKNSCGPSIYDLEILKGLFIQEGLI